MPASIKRGKGSEKVENFLNEYLKDIHRSEIQSCVSTLVDAGSGQVLYDSKHRTMDSHLDRTNLGLYGDGLGESAVHLETLGRNAHTMQRFPSPPEAV